MTDYENDLRTRWVPSKEQDAEAAAALQGLPPRGQVFTAHVLVNKHYGWWGLEVEVQHLPGVHQTVEGACDAAKEAAHEIHLATGKPVTGGWARHYLPRDDRPPPTSHDGTRWLTDWAVFEDILAVFPKPDRTRE